MKRFIIDFLIAFLIIIGIFGMSGNNSNEINSNEYNNEVKDENGNIENVKNYNGNLINRISFKINGLIQEVADFGFDIFKSAIKSFLE